MVDGKRKMKRVEREEKEASCARSLFVFSVSVFA
jgi:hypothetical protein